jgi:hypothetical protein
MAVARQLPIPFRNALAILIGIVLGCAAGHIAFFGDDLTFVLLVAGFVVTPIPVCLIATRGWVWTSLIPVITSQVTLLTLSYLRAYKPNGTDLSTYISTRIYSHWFWWLLWWTPGVLIAAAFYAFKSPARRAA